MARRDQDAGTCLPGPVRGRWFYKNDAPGVGGSSKREFEDEIFRWCPWLRCDEFTDFAGETSYFDVYVPLFNSADANEIPTTVSASGSVRVTRAGTLISADLVTRTALAQNDTNFIQLQATNKLGAGAGSQAMLTSASGANSTKVTGGAALAADTPFTLTVTPQGVTTYVNDGDVIAVVATVTGTLGAVITKPVVRLRFATVGSGFRPRTTRTAAFPGAVPVLNSANGEVNLALDATAETQYAGIDAGDQLVIPGSKRGIFSARVQIVATIAASQDVIIGFGTALASPISGITKYARFRFNASMAALIEGNDGTNTLTLQTPSRTAQTIAAGTYYVFTVDLRDPGNVRFFIDTQKIGTLNLSAFAATDLLQPMIGVQKTAGAGTPSVLVDWVRTGWNRI